MGESASKKFWNTPELVEMLFPHLDASSILELAKAHQPTIEILQGGATWDILIKRICPFGVKGLTLASLREELKAKKVELSPLIKLLAMMEEPQGHLLNLLNTICSRFPTDETREYPVKVADDNMVLVPEFVEVTDSNMMSHKVSLLGFLVLEEVEGALGSSEQSVKRVSILSLQGIVLSSLSARMLRQPGEMFKMELAGITCINQQEAEDLLVLMKNCESLTGTTRISPILEVKVKITPEAWATLAKVVELHPGKFFLCSTREALLACQRKDLKIIWEAVRIVHVLHSHAVGDVIILKNEGWERLEEVLDMSEDQWRAEAQEAFEVEGEEEDDEEEEEVEEEELEEDEEEEEDDGLEG